MTQRHRMIVGLSLLIAVSCVLPVRAEEDRHPLAWQAGPKAITVGDKLATIDLTKEYAFAGKEDMQRVEKAMGNPVDGNELGMIISTDKAQNWMIYLDYEPMGYVKDDEGDKLDAKAILESMQKGNEEANERRKEEGIPPIHIIGWQVPPHYDKVTHNLEWELVAQSGDEKLVNANTRLLGRRGVVSVTLAGSPEDVRKAQSRLDDIIRRFQYNKGNKYSDFVPGQDKVAELGLTALVAGGLGAAAVKTGLFAKFILPILLVLKKFVIVIFAAVAGLFSKLKNLFTGKKNKPDQPGGE